MWQLVFSEGLAIVIPVWVKSASFGIVQMMNVEEKCP